MQALRLFSIALHNLKAPLKENRKQRNKTMLCLSLIQLLNICYEFHWAYGEKVGNIINLIHRVKYVSTIINRDSL